MSEQEKLTKLEEVLEMDEGTLSPEMVLEDIVEYDSMAKLGLILMFEDDFGKKFTGKEIADFKIVSDILTEMS